MERHTVFMNGKTIPMVKMKILPKLIYNLKTLSKYQQGFLVERLIVKFVWKDTAEIILMKRIKWEESPSTLRLPATVIKTVQS